MFNTVKTKIALLAGIPLLLILAFTISGISEKYRTLDEINRLEQLSRLSVKISALVHETQKERGRTGGFMGSKGKKFEAELEQQRNKTDEKRSDLNLFLNTFDKQSIGPEFSNKLDSALSKMSAIDEHRNKVSALSLTDTKAIGFYTTHNTLMLDVIQFICKTSSNAQMGVLLGAYINFLQGKERAGIERAVLTNTFAADRFKPDMFLYFLSLVNDQATYFRVFKSFAGKDQIEFYDKKMTDSSVLEVKKMRAIAMEKGASRQISNLLTRLLQHIGYGGAIHEFKNFLLRRDLGYEKEFYVKYREISRLLDQMDGIEDITDKERGHIRTIRETMGKYNSAISSARQMVEEGKTIKSIDKTIKIDDSPALSAIQELAIATESGNFGIDPGTWFKTITRKINLMKTVEDKLSSDINTKSAALSTQAQKALILFAFIAFFVVATGMIAVFMARRISAPLVLIAKAAESYKTGDLSYQFDYSSGDEIGTVADAFRALGKAQQKKVDLSTTIAAGDLTREVELASDRDELGHALVKMVGSLSRLVRQVSNGAVWIASGSRKVSDSSQTLSQGATEQASSVEEITATMTEIGAQTKANAQNATQANQLAGVTRDSAEQGNSQMLEMVSAMDDISDSSKEISKIIKVIDAIAFQTNLLALNAAVEAARAGKHGKGFAVVAQEVRNLAARSAKAANETSELIDGATKKVETGTQMADKTAKALEEIVGSVTKVADLVGEIAAASNEQAQGISQINEGLSQIDTVTQQNSAVAEETASAAEELSGHASQLQQQLSCFKLKEEDRISNDDAFDPNTDNLSSALPPAAPAVAKAFTDSPMEPATGNGPAVNPEQVIVLDDKEFGKF